MKTLLNGKESCYSHGWSHKLNRPSLERCSSSNCKGRQNRLKTPRVLSMFFIWVRKLKTGLTGNFKFVAELDIQDSFLSLLIAASPDHLF